MVGVVSIPGWLENLIGEEFFRPCGTHEFSKKNEKKMFCLECSATMCAHCIPLHRLHSLLQIRRYVYNDVIRLCDAQKLLDCSLVQSYKTNSAKVVFLRQRPLSRPFKASRNFCIKCDRTLQHPFFFCSLSCKVHHIKGINKQEKLVYKRGHVQLADDQITPDSVLDSPGSTPTTSSDNTWNKMKRSSGISLPRTAVNRRKSIPQRSPLY